MNHVLISLGTGFVLFLFISMGTGNIVMGMVIGIGTGMLLSIVTDPDYQRRRRERLARLRAEEKENRRWKRKGYHKEYGKRTASDEFDKQKEYDAYDELDIRNIGFNKKRFKQMWGD